MSDLPAYMTDTHGLIWYLIGSPRLSNRARRTFDDVVSNQAILYIPVIVLAELIMLLEKRRIVADLDDMLALIQDQEAFLLQPLSSDVTLAIRDLPGLSDIHDRLIVAEAQAHNAILITQDRTITASGLVSVVW